MSQILRVVLYKVWLSNTETTLTEGVVEGWGGMNAV